MFHANYLILGCENDKWDSVLSALKNKTLPTDMLGLMKSFTLVIG